MDSALVTPSGGSLVNADRVPVGPNDSLVALQADQYQGSDPNILSGGISGDDVGSTGLGRGRVRGAGSL